MPIIDGDLVDVTERAASHLGAYVHIPFCEAVCPYCDFAVVAGQDDETDRYLDALIAEIVSFPPKRPVDAVFVGGGTPSRVERLADIIEAITDTHGLVSNAEITLEANPEDWTEDLSNGEERAKSLVAAGFNRVSFGAQSYDPVVLDYLGRRHDPAQIDRAVELSRQAGFRSISLDLIFGSPPETPESWWTTLYRAIQARPDHVSTYALTVERGTELSRLVNAGAAAPDADVQADRYEVAEELLGAAGYRRYEVSNYARPGHECQYNLTAWAQGEYMAFGMGAHGHLDGTRFRNVRRLEAYLSAIESSASPRAGADDVIADRDEERIILGLRRASGVSVDPLVDAFMASPSGERLVSAGVIGIINDRLVVLKPLLTDDVCSSFLVSRS